MIEVHCPVHRAAVLLADDRIDGLRKTADGMVVDWRCWCDHRGRTVVGHRARPQGAAALPT